MHTRNSTLSWLTTSSPLGEEEISLTKKNYHWPQDEKFLVPEGVYDHFRDGMGQRGKTLRQDWMKQFDAYKKQHPQLADHLYKM